MLAERNYLRRTGPPSWPTGRSGNARLFAVLIVALLLGTAAYLIANRDRFLSTGGAEDDLGFPYVRLDLAHEVEYTPPEIEVAYSWHAEREQEGVSVLAKSHTVQPRDVAGKKELMLLMRGKGEKQVDIAGEFDPARFNRVVLRVLTFASEAIHIAMVRDDEEFLATSAQVVRGSRDPQNVVFDIPEARNVQRPFTGLRIYIEGRSKPTAILSFDLLKRPLAAWLPPVDSPRPVEIRLESQIAVGLSSERPIVGETILPPNARLTFGYGQPRELLGRGQGTPKLRVTIEQGAESHTEEFDLPDGTATKQQWRTADISLAKFSDRRAQVRFEFDVDGSMEGLCALAQPVLYARGKEPPTVLLITSDTHRADHLGSSDSPHDLETPELDALAKRGVLFEHAFSSTNVTNPSHIALMTATHPRDTEIINNHVQLSEAATTLAECFREAGYMTYASLCAKHLGHTTSGLGQGFDRMIRPKHAFTDAEVAINSLSEWMPDADGRPLFIWLHVFDAHHPYGPPEEYDKRYWDPNKDPFDPNLPPVELPNGIDVSVIFPPDLLELRDLEFPKAQYKAEITYLDSELGRVFAWPRMSSAWIAMTADHGESFGEHGVYYDHAGAYPQNVHVPLILAGPNVPRDARAKMPVEQLDIGRTLLDLAELETATFPGRNLLDTLTETTGRPQYTISAHGFDASITHERLHLVLHLRDGQSTELRTYTRCHTELYDLDRDPECTVDLWESAEYADRGVALRKQLVEWLDRAQPTGWAVEGALTAETQAELQGLGYAASAASRESRVWFEDCEN